MKKIATLLMVSLLAGSTQAQTNVTKLFSFDATNGAAPQAALTIGPDGAFYGTTSRGGNGIDTNQNYGFGTIFKITTNETFSTLYYFSSTNGSPESRLTMGYDGKLYGTTFGYDPYDYGTIFNITTNGIFTTLFRFSNTNGAGPFAGLTLGKDGSFYGTTSEGGTYYQGTLFRFSPPNTFVSLASFQYFTNGGFPHAELTLGSDGFFYGTTEYGGTSGNGTIFKTTTDGIITTMYQFDGVVGSHPEARLILGNDGNFYGTTYADSSDIFNSIIFRISPSGNFSTVVHFDYYHDGASPNELTLGADGFFYGTTQYGGGYGYGTVFKVSTNGTLITLASFTNNNGANPRCALTVGMDNFFYGTTSGGGKDGLFAIGYGTMFKLANAAPTIVVPPAFGITTISNFPVLVWPSSATNFVLQISTNLSTGSWVNVAGGVPFSGVMVTNSGGNAFFRLH